MEAINMKTKLIAISMALLFLLVVEGIAFAQTANVGVAKGETFDYSYSIQWSSNDPTAVMPSSYAELNNTQTIQFTVTDISNAQISLEKTTTFKNGTQTSENGYININTGDIEINYGMVIVGSGLNVGDKLYPVGGHAIVNSTTTRTYPSGQRETNYYISQTGTPDNLVQLEIYYDKLVGAAVNYYWENTETSDNYTTSTTETLTSTNANVWVVANNPIATTSVNTPIYTSGHMPTKSAVISSPIIWIIIAVIIIVVIVPILVLSLRRRRPKAKHKNKTQENQQGYLGTF
jgi:hypothetical protein